MHSYGYSYSYSYGLDCSFRSSCSVLCDDSIPVDSVSGPGHAWNATKPALGKYWPCAASVRVALHEGGGAGEPGRFAELTKGVGTGAHAVVPFAVTGAGFVDVPPVAGAGGGGGGGGGAGGQQQENDAGLQQQRRRSRRRR